MMQQVEDALVLGAELVEREMLEFGESFAHADHCGAARVLMIDQRVVEVEQDCAYLRHGCCIGKEVRRGGGEESQIRSAGATSETSFPPHFLTFSPNSSRFAARGSVGVATAAARQGGLPH